ncbi:MAG TPA: hypothetical protein PLA50_14825, partial [Bacteroidia bacterium]|nr:hypothetical protein [Bacteroidia bacterium]
TAHVIPDSMGGAAATARLLREGVTVTGSVMVGEKFILSGLSDEDIEEVAKFLDIQYDRRELRLVYRDPEVEGGVFRWKVDGDKLIAISSAFRVMWIEGRW